MKANDGIHLLPKVSTRVWIGAIAALSLLAVSGCVVPVRLPARTKGISGNPKQLDFTFLKAGSTKRDEISTNLAVIDTGVKQDNIFWGRWESSTWGSAEMGIGMGAGRIWWMHNLLIQLDHNGLVKSWVVVDDKHLDHELDLFDRGTDDSPLNLSSPLRVKATHFLDKVPTDLLLTSDSLEYEYEDGRHVDRFFQLKIPRIDLRKIASTPGAEQPNVLVVTVYFARPVTFVTNHNNKKGHFTSKNICLVVDPQTFLLLRHYMQGTHSVDGTDAPAKRMSWEGERNTQHNTPATEEVH
jgi:hypothetical protein